MAEPLTDEELEEELSLDGHVEMAEGHCYRCLRPWPCKRVRLRATIDADREALRGLGTQAIRDFVGRVNRRAEAEMQRTGTLEGAHHRGIEAELAALPAGKA